MTKIRCSLRVAISFCLGLGISSFTWAVKDAETDFSSLTLKELVELDVFTSASLLPTKTNKAPGTVYSFNRRDFKSFGVRRLDDLLAFVPGIQLNQYRKRHRSIWGRGLLDRYNSKIILMVDGVRMQHLYYGHFSLGDNFPLENIEKVEVILGPASSLYGANAFGGIISVTTRDFSEQPQLEVTLEAADNNRAKGTLFSNSEHFQAFGSYLEQDAPFSDNRRSFIGGDVNQPLDEEYKNFRVKARPVNGLTLMLDYVENDTPFLFIPKTQDAFIEEEFLSLAANYKTGSLDEGSIETTVYYQNDKAREFEKEQVTQSLGYEEYQNATMAGASVTGMQRWNEHTLALGVTWQHEEAEKTEYKRLYRFSTGFLPIPEQGDLLTEPGISNDDYAVFLQDVWALNSTTELTVGGRYDSFDRFDDHVNYRAALVYTPGNRQTWKTQYGTAIRTPSFREYLKVLEGTTFQPPSVDAEEIESLEVGYLYQWDEANLSVTVFHNEVEGYIREVPTPDTADEYFANSDKTLRLQGVEALVNVRPVEELNIRLGAAYQESEIDGDDMPYLYDWSASFRLDYNYYASHSLGFTLIHNNTRSDTNTFSDDDADAFVITNLFVHGSLTPRASYSLGVDNVFDEEVFDAAADFGGQYNTERSQREVWLRLEWELTQ